jgi:VWFA-related protein
VIRQATAAITIVGLTAAAVVLAQAPRAAVEEFPIAVSVRLPNGQPVHDLAAADFAVLEDGQRVSITSFSTAKSLALVVLVSDQERMVKHRPRARVAAETILGLLETGDRAAMRGVQSLRGGFQAIQDVPRLIDGLNQVLSLPATSDRATDSGSWTSMRDAGIALKNLAPPPDVHAIIALSSGLDFVTSDEHQSYSNRYEFGSPADENAARREDAAMTTAGEGVVVFGFGFNGTGDDKHLQRLSHDSGGRFVEANRNINLRSSTEQVMRDLRSRYVLRFVPQSLDGRRHTLEVLVRRPGLVVHARSFHSATIRKNAHSSNGNLPF